MAKKFGKFLAFSMFAGAAAAGTYYYLKKKQEDPLDDMDDFDDFDDFNEDLDDDLDEQPSPSSNSKNRAYVSLDFENAKEVISEKVIETIDKAKEKIEEFNVSEKLDKAKEKIEEFAGSDQDKTVASSTSPVEHADHIDVAEQTTAAQTTEPSEKEDTVEEFFDDSEDE